MTTTQTALLATAQQAIALLAAAGAKRFATLQARFALAGHTLRQSGPGDGLGAGYLAERWGMARHLPTLDDADEFLAQIEGAGHNTLRQWGGTS